ncbi:MAG: PorP/SprF family type IX secretion system membrane protein [Flavobacteriales bacterium]|nr:PorP/SprF family type IX secretion system membrane protein [Flavobacteriales bacterium]
MKWSLTIALVATIGVAWAQDPQFSQFYSAPLYMNPGFAGNTIQARGVINYRNQWPAMPGKFVSYAASFDYNIEELNSGLALSFQQDRAGTAALRYSNIALQYSYTLRLSRYLAIKPGISFSYSFRDVNRAELIFGDQLIYDNPTSQSSTRFDYEPVRYPDLGAGSILYSRNWWAGMAFHHINRPNQSLIAQESRLPIRFSVHGGYNVVMKKDVKKKDVSSFTFVAHYKAQGKWDQLDIGAYFKYRIITTGLYYRGLPLVKTNGYKQPNHDALTALIGFEYKDLSFGYSYDLTLSKLITNSGGAHEISIIYEMASDRRKRSRRRSRFFIPCAKF